MSLFDVPSIPRVKKEPATDTVVPVFTLLPKEAGHAPFQFQMRSFPNSGDGDGTFNNGAWLGWNAAVFSLGDAATGSPGLYMGFEDNFFDESGDGTFGVEWYTGYTTPDGTTIGRADLRPLYWRVIGSDTDTPDKSVIISLDIGSGADGSLAVMGSVNTRTQLFSITPSSIHAALPTVFTAPGGAVRIIPDDGYASLELVAPGTGTGGAFGVISWRFGEHRAWVAGATADTWFVQDAAHGDRQQVSLTPGDSDQTALTTLRSNLAVKGGFGMNGATPKPRAPAIKAPVSQPPEYTQSAVQSIVTAVNSIRQMLYDVGITE